MTGNEYQKLAMRINDCKCEERLEKALKPNVVMNTPEMVMGCLGLAREAGEFNDLVKKFIFHEKPIDYVQLQKEIGDVCWYIALLCTACHCDLESIMQTNIKKLEARYPKGLDTERANNRDKADV